MNRELLLAQPTRVRYGVLGWFCTLSMITYIDRVCIMQVQDEMQRDLGLTRTQFAWAFSAFALAYAAFEVPTGWLGDKIGPRKVLTRIVLCWLLFTALTGCVPRWDDGFYLPLTDMFLSGSLVLLLAVRFLFGAGEAGAYPNIARGSKNWFPFSERGRAQGLVWTFGRWGGSIAPVLIVALAYPFDQFQVLAGWRGAFLMLGVLGVIWVVAFSWFFRDTPQDHPRVNEAELALIEGPAYQPRSESGPGEPAQETGPASTDIVPGTSLGPPPEEGITERPTAEDEQPQKPPPLFAAPLSWPSLLGSSTLWWLSFMYFCSNSGWSFFITWVSTYLKKDLQMTSLTLHLASGMPLFMGGFGCMLGGFLTDRLVPVFGRRWGRTGQGLLAYFFGAALFLAGGLLTGSWPLVAFMCICLASFVKDLAMAASWSTTIDIGHRYSGTVAGLMNTIGNLGTVVTPPIVAHLVVAAEARGVSGWSVSLYYYATMFFIASVCWFFINPRKVIVYRPEDRQRLEASGVLT